MKKEDVIFERKEFLNMAGHHGQANVIAQIVKYDYTPDDELSRNIEVTLDIADCSRVISLEMDTGSDEYRENSIHKVDTLIDVLSDFRKTLVKEFKYQKRLEKKRKKRDEENGKE